MVVIPDTLIHVHDFMYTHVHVVVGVPVHAITHCNVYMYLFVLYCILTLINWSIILLLLIIDISHSVSNYLTVIIIIIYYIQAIRSAYNETLINCINCIIILLLSVSAWSMALWKASTTSETVWSSRWWVCCTMWMYMHGYI